MTNKNNVGLIVLAIAILIVGVYGGKQGWFQNISYSSITNQETKEILEQQQTTSAVCALSLDKTSVNLGDVVKGTIRDGALTLCAVYSQKDGVWKKEFEGTTDINGNLVGNRQLETVGNYLVKALCGQGTSKECVTNGVTLIVNSLITDSDGDGIPDSTDPDDDNDGYTDIEEIGAGTNPNDLNSHPTTTTCNSVCTSKGFASGRGAFSSGSSCIGTEVIEYLVGNMDDICCCLPYADNQPTSYTCGQGTDKNNCQGTCPTNYRCEQIESETNRWCACVQGADEGIVHVDWKPTGQYYNPTPIEQPPEPVICSDTDATGTGMYSLLTKGTCTDVHGTFTDTTSSGVLTEYYCQDNQCNSHNYICSTMFPGGTAPVGFGECLANVNYYDTNAYYYVSWDYNPPIDGQPLRHANGRIGTWHFVTSSGGTGSGLPIITLRIIVISGGSSSINIPLQNHNLINFDDFLSNYEGKFIRIKLESLTSNGVVMSTTLEGTVNFA